MGDLYILNTIQEREIVHSEFFHISVIVLQMQGFFLGTITNAGLLKSYLLLAMLADGVGINPQQSAGMSLCGSFPCLTILHFAVGSLHTSII